MTSFVLALLVSQVPPAAESPEVGLFAQWVQRNLITVQATQGGLEVRQRERSFRLQDEDFADAFALVPEAQTLAQRAREAFLSGARFQIAGLIALGPVLVLTVVATLLPTSLVLPLLLVGLGCTGVGLVLTLIALPFMLTAQSKFFSAVATYDRGLLELRPPPPGLSSGGVTITLP